MNQGVKARAHTKGYLLKGKSGQSWYFFISDDSRLLYSIKNKGDWSKPVPIDRNLVKSFSAAIDANDKIYMLVYTHTKLLFYYEWDGYQWLHKLIYRIQSRFENIPFLSVQCTGTVRGAGSVSDTGSGHSTGSAVHIFYYLENALSRSRESLVHFYLQKHDWEKAPSIHFSSDELVTPAEIAADKKGNIHFIYHRYLNYDYSIYMCSLDKSSQNWKPAELICKTSNIPENFNAFVDDDSSIHIVWSEKQGIENGIGDDQPDFDEEYDFAGIKYLKIKNSKAEVDSDKPAPKVVTVGEADKDEPILLHFSDKPYCFYKFGDSIEYVVLKDGMTGKPKIYKEGMIDISYYYNTSISDEDPLPTILAAGDGYPDFSWSTLDIMNEGKTKNTSGGLMSYESSMSEISDYSGSKVKKSEDEKRVNEEDYEEYEVQGKKKESVRNGRKTADDAIDNDDILSLKNQLSSLSSRVDDLYTSLYILRDHIAERDKSIYYLQNTVKLITSRYNAGRQAAQSKDMISNANVGMNSKNNIYIKNGKNEIAIDNSIIDNSTFDKSIIDKSTSDKSTGVKNVAISQTVDINNRVDDANESEIKGKAHEDESQELVNQASEAAETAEAELLTMKHEATHFVEMDDKDDSPEEITLGNVSILINPEDDVV